MKPGFLITVLVATVWVCCGMRGGYAAELPYALLAEGEFFSVYADPQVDSEDLLERINFDYFYQLEMMDSQEAGLASPRQILAKTLDGVYLEVCDTLGIGLYSFHGILTILPDRQSLNAEYQALFQKEFSAGSFYVYETNALYVSAGDLSVGLIVHEITHIVLSHYFVVPPSEKLQDILSEYVDYHFRKQLGSF